MDVAGTCIEENGWAADRRRGLNPHKAHIRTTKATGKSTFRTGNNATSAAEGVLEKLAERQAGPWDLTTRDTCASDSCRAFHLSKLLTELQLPVLVLVIFAGKPLYR